MHVRTHTHIHIYTHTHTKCTYERTQSTSETRARQRLRGKPTLTPSCSALLPVRCNLERETLRGHQPNCPSRGTMDKRRTTTTNSSSLHHNDSAPSRPHPLICTGAELIQPVHGPPKLRAWPWPPETRSFFCHFGGSGLSWVFTTQERKKESGLICDLILRGGRGLLPEGALPEEYRGHNLDEQCLEDTGESGALPIRREVITSALFHIHIR